MSVHYILDGYNIIRCIPGLTSPKLETSRHNLFHFLADARPQGSSKNTLTIVFDGQGGSGGFAEEVPGIQVIFSSDDSADEEIKRLVAAADQRKNMIVVTNDREIQYYVRALGAKILSVQEFFEKGFPSVSFEQQKVRTKGKSLTDGKNISKTTEHQINTEFEGVWLKRKKRS